MLFALRIGNNENFNLLSTIIIQSLGKYYKSSYVQKVERAVKTILFQVCQLTYAPYKRDIFITQSK